MNALDSCSMLVDQLQRDGFAIIPRAISSVQVERLLRDLTDSLALDNAKSSPLQTRGTIYAARNPLEVLPWIAELWQQNDGLGPFLEQTLGSRFGLVRGLFFDKPPEHSWSLPWHKDLTIAVRDNGIPSAQFTRPTMKAGVPHVIAPVELLQSMLTIRLHLDDVNDENGPLRVIPGSHLTGKEIVACDRDPTVIHAFAGDALAMRPLLMHASSESSPGTAAHRRILHLEFAAKPDLPDGYAWQRFVRGSV